MPNWCNNQATLTHADPAMIERVMNSEDSGILKEFVPCPAELLDDDLTTWSQGPEQEAREAKRAAMLEKYGHESWYDWQISNWGTKWDLCEVSASRVDDNTVELYFDTAWSPPIEAYQTLLDQGFSINAYYYEPGMAFAGSWNDGAHDAYELSGMSPNDVEDLIPQELDDAFGIVESMREWGDDDPEEELTEWIKDGAEQLEQGKD